MLVSLQISHEIIELDANTYSGSGCIAALEAEKFLAEQEAEVENDLDQEKQAEKGSNVVVPEYRSNPLL